LTGHLINIVTFGVKKKLIFSMEPLHGTIIPGVTVKKKAKHSTAQQSPKPKIIIKIPLNPYVPSRDAVSGVD
jgi:hypothetical protein